MAIHISNLTVPQEEKKVRDYINTPTGKIEIYEPTIEVADALIDIQRQEGVDFGEDATVVFDAVTVVKHFFPLLTNIDFSDVSDEELSKIIDNPSVHLLIAQNLIAQIISDVNKLYAEKIKTEIASAESVLSQAELISQIPTLMVEQAMRNGDHEFVRKVDEASRELDEAVENANSQEELADKVEEVINLKANASDIADLASRVEKAEAQITVTAGEISQRVTKDEFDK
ncbi:hypothetical protein ACW5UC_25090 [Priestia aryabhattai]|uniref:hypothetical protein n=1 Tax=Priestia megaterium TaxID=1404 RepID=UPI003F987C87